MLHWYQYSVLMSTQWGVGTHTGISLKKWHWTFSQTHLQSVRCVSRLKQTNPSLHFSLLQLDFLRGALIALTVNLSLSSFCHQKLRVQGPEVKGYPPLPREKWFTAFNLLFMCFIDGFDWRGADKILHWAC